MLNANVGYIDYNTLTLGALGQIPTAFSGIESQTPRPIGIPTWKVSLGGQYTYDFGDYGSLTERLDWIYQSTVTYNFLGTSQFAQPGYGVLNAHLTWASQDGDWQGTLEVSNVTGQVYYLNKTINATDVNGQPGKPREFLFTLKRSFGGGGAAAAAYNPPPPLPPAQPTLPPAARVEPQREFQVFFDFDKSDITEAAANVIQAAADVVKAGGIAHITVTGHTDTVGTSAYNKGLSERRAAAVKSALTADGVDGGEIGTVGVGKTGLLVPTGGRRARAAEPPCGDRPEVAAAARCPVRGTAPAVSSLTGAGGLKHSLLSILFSVLLATSAGAAESWVATWGAAPEPPRASSPVKPELPASDPPSDRPDQRRRRASPHPGYQ